MRAEPLRLVFRPAALSDLTAIWRFGAGRWGVAQADRYAGSVDRLCRLLCTDPLLGRAEPELGEGLRLAVHAPHLVLYRVAGGRLEVVRILHERLDRRRGI
ncbi:type II toxin-antitoxin system RelE/ParE family toxin [Oceaniglobus roseus]|uniref:type II toxin-antitoxin system RelE/ParE family toxin n=1 Tax=Oceaniglobus roseus TaxID=1737570 RepID=UPI000C7F3E95|nr:type II toxin-antitoxin system RelE/ParE family toxin [Kandeliimicrobium roseum]